MNRSNKLFLILASATLTMASIAQAQDCRLRTPVTLAKDVLAARKTGVPAYLAFKQVTLDHVPLGATGQLTEKQNGNYTLQVHQIFYGGGLLAAETELPTGMYGAVILGGPGFGLGFSNVYGGVTLQSQVMQQNGEMVYTTTDASAKVAQILTLKIRGTQITSIELKNPVMEEPKPGIVRQSGATDTICVLSMVPDDAN